MLNKLPIELLEKTIKKCIIDIEDVIKYKYINKRIYQILIHKDYYQFILNEFMDRYTMLEHRCLYFENKVIRLDYVLNYDTNSDSYFDIDSLTDDSDITLGSLSD